VRELLTPEQVAEHLHMDVKSIHRLVREGKLGCVQMTARKRLFRSEDVEDFILSRTISPPKRVDKRPSPPVRSGPKSMKGGAKSTGESVRALREEMRSWQ